MAPSRADRLHKIRERLANLHAFGYWGISSETALGHYIEDVEFLLTLAVEHESMPDYQRNPQGGRRE